VKVKERTQRVLQVIKKYSTLGKLQDNGGKHEKSYKEGDRKNKSRKIGQKADNEKSKRSQPTRRRWRNDEPLKATNPPGAFLSTRERFSPTKSNPIYKATLVQHNFYEPSKLRQNNRTVLPGKR
jgi:hypothetical protein